MKTFEEIKNQLREGYNSSADKENQSFMEWIDSESEKNPGFFRDFYGDDAIADFASPCDLSDERYNQWNDFCDYIEDGDTYDVHYDDETSSNNEGFQLSYRECLDFIRKNNGTDNSYFEDYKGGMVSIYSNDTEEIVYQETIR